MGGTPPGLLKNNYSAMSDSRAFVYKAIRAPKSAHCPDNNPPERGKIGQKITASHSWRINDRNSLLDDKFVS
jgi:hypothetical protein